ncbi:hypothetical protein FA95DRAFT_682704 [Auriscalpium vulgare]|uniref:Uncharacterized protein n=1 Tax=Auriscalpium vulgare TaxID=40419 RepID=A0ACB8S0J8_9AGAM|nr:hypothetical protein FA95DRAFT_682704 [Auriscalpium vulgare]
MASFIVLLSFTVFPVLTIASPNPLPLPALLSPLSARSLEGRQFDPSTAGTPAQCQSVCLPAFNAIDACDGTVACVCSASTVAGMKSCYGCVYGSDSAGENAALDGACTGPLLSATSAHYQSSAAYTQDICAQAEPPVSGPTVRHIPRSPPPRRLLIVTLLVHRPF